MKLPFVSRERFEELKAEAADLKQKVSSLQEENRKLMNQIVWRATTVALEPDLLPEHYRPKAVVVSEPTKDPYADPKKSPTMGSAAMRARQRIREAEQENELAFRRRQGFSVPPTETTDERRDKAEVLSALNQAADEGVAAAHKESA